MNLMGSNTSHLCVPFCVLIPVDHQSPRWVLTVPGSQFPPPEHPLDHKDPDTGICENLLQGFWRCACVGPVDLTLQSPCLFFE